MTRREARSHRISHWLSIVLLATAAAWMTFDARGFDRLLRILVPDEAVVLYPTKPLPMLVWEQLYLAGAASVFAIILGASMGAVALSPVGKPFRDLIVNTGNLAQTVPTVALMALMIPATGYGSEPVVIALVLYGVLPVLLNVIAGIEGVPPDAADAAIGVGMSVTQRFWRVQLPLAMPVIMGGIKNMVVINISAATLGAVVAAGGLGMPILAGFHDFNNAFILEGALPAIVLALLADRLLTTASIADPTLEG